MASSCVSLATPACLCFPDQFPPVDNSQLALEVELSATNGTVPMTVAPSPIRFNAIRTAVAPSGDYCFNTDWGVFTAPSTGAYAFDFDVSVSTPAAASSCTLTYGLYVNGTSQAATINVAATTAAGQTVNDHFHANLSLQRGDVVQVLASSTVGGPAWVFATNVFPSPSPTSLSITSLPPPG